MVQLTLSAIDEARFGVRTAKARADDPAAVEDLLSRSRSQGVSLLILRIPVSAHAAVAIAEGAGAQLMDVLCHYEHRLSVPSEAEPVTPPGDRVEFRLASPSDADLVERLARLAFQDYPSHYQNDPRLSRSDVAEVYPSWARSCCEQATAQEPVLLLLEQQQCTGFAALRRVAVDQLDVALLAIAPMARRRNRAALLLAELLAAASKLEARRLTYSTQITNVAMQRALARSHFLPTHSDYTFHLWTQSRR